MFFQEEGECWRYLTKHLNVPRLVAEKLLWEDGEQLKEVPTATFMSCSLISIETENRPKLVGIKSLCEVYHRLCTHSINKRNTRVGVTRRLEVEVQKQLSNLTKSTSVKTAHEAIGVSLSNEFKCDYSIAKIERNQLNRVRNCRFLRDAGELQKAEFVHAVQAATKISQNDRAINKSGNIAIFGQGNRQIVIKPLIALENARSARTILLLVRNAEFTINEIEQIDDISDNFIYKYISSGKNRILSSAQSSITARDRLQTKHSEIGEDFLAYLKDAFSDIFQVCDCHSVTVRFYNPTTRTLDVFYSKEKPDEDFNDRNPNGNSIKLSRFRESANAYTFLYGHAYEQYTYIPNLRSGIPEKYRKRGLDSARRTRESLAEICFPVFHGKTPCAVLNLESATRSAFDGDIEFLLALKAAIENKYSRYFDGVDTRWMRERALVGENLHDLKNMLTGGFFTDSQKLWLREKFFPETKSNAIVSLDTTFKNLRLEILGWIDDSFSELIEWQVQSIKDILSFSGDPAVRVDKKLFQSILEILRALIINIENNSYIERDKIIVSCDARYRDSSNRDCLRIRFRTYGKFPPEVLDTATLAPIQKHTNSGVTDHYGLYLIGLLVRSNDGSVFIGPEGGDGERIFELSFAEWRADEHSLRIDT